MKKHGKFLLVLSDFKKVVAFTLAEVLIVVGIIGIVAEITIPPLIASYQKTQYLTGLKKGYSELMQVFGLYLADQGVTSLDQTDLFTQDGSTAFESSPTRQAILDKMVRKYFRVAKICQVNDISCTIHESYFDPSYGDGDFFNYSYNFYTMDGISFNIYLYPQSSCTPDYSKPSNMKAMCGEIQIDVNGNKPPNKMGRDFYMGLLIGPDGNLYPFRGRSFAQYMNGTNWATSANYWNIIRTSCGTIGGTAAGSSGQECAARIIDEKWEMNY